nr:hypothetical protein [Streptomyces sp. NBC_01565]
MAAAFLAATGALATFAAIAAGACATATATEPVAIGAVAFLPAPATRLARLPIRLRRPAGLRSAVRDPRPSRRRPVR